MIAYRTNPHLDQFERGWDAALLLDRALRGKAHPVQALVTPPLLIQLSQQYTDEAPARLLYEDLEQVLRWPGILSASVALGFYYADVAEMGMSFIAVSDNDASLAQHAAEWLADRAWQRRQQFVRDLPDAKKAVAMAMHSQKKPVVIMDTGDNVGGGSPADSTILLRELVDQGARNALIILYDPEAVRECIRSGIRSEVTLRVGAKTDKLHGAPVEIRGRVRTVADGIFVEKQIRHGGWGGGDQGLTAVVETHEEHTIILTSHRMAPMSLEQITSLGVHPEWKAILVAKGVNAPRAAYAPIAGEMILSGTPGVTNDNPSQFLYEHARKQLFPLQTNTQFSIPV
jgi:microcystin degradation protein MlrC